LSDTITFTGVVLKSFSREHTGGDAKFSSNITAANRKTMGWAEFPDGATKVVLEGDLAASSAEITPENGALAKWTIAIQASAVGSFVAQRYESEGSRKKGYRYELHFTLKFKDMTACRELESFITHIGDVKSTLVVSYTKAAEQLPLDGPTATDQQRLAAAADAD
jgi:hypothetical protein